MIELKENIQLVERRCEHCRRWYATERSSEWVCGSCKHARNDELLAQLRTLERSNAALRGLLAQRQRRSRKA